MHVRAVSFGDRLFTSISSAGRGQRRAMAIASLLCLTLGVEARAQEPTPVAAPPPPPSAVEPPAPPPPVSAPEAPPLTPPAVAPAPAPSQPPASTTVAMKPPLSWAGTTFAWENQFSAHILGVGPDYIGSDEYDTFVTAFSLTPRYFILWRPRHQLSASTNFTVFSELTDSRTTAVEHSAQIADLPLGLDYAATLFSHGHGKSLGGFRTMKDPTLLGEGDYRTWALVSTYLVFPTSESSRAAGVQLATSIGVGLRQQIKLLGGDSRWLSYLLITGSESWSHTFASQSVYSDSFGSAAGYRLPTNTFVHALTFTLPIYRELHLDSSFKLKTALLPSNVPGQDDCTIIATGCVDVPSGSKDFSGVRTSTFFSVGLSAQIIPELGVALGYLNDAPQIGANGLKRSIFSSENAQFYTNMTVSLDRLYQHFFPPKPASAEPMR